MTKVNVKTGKSYQVGQQLTKIEWSGLYIFPVLHKYFKNLLYMFFDFNNMKNKSLSNKLLPIEWTITEDGEALQWYDYNTFDVEIPAVAGVASAATLDVTVIANDVTTTTQGFAIGDQILVVRKEWSPLPNARREITVLTNTVITVDSAVAIEAGDRIIRVYYVQAREAEITRGFSKYNYIEFKSYFQNFGREVTFKKTELNKTYLLEKDAKTYVSNIVGYNMQILLQEVCKAIWLGQNNNDSNEPEMLGIDTAITEVAVKDPSVLVDFSTAPNDDEKLNIFMDAIEASGASGAILPGETLTIACNRKMLSALGRLKKDDVVYNDKIVEIDFTIYKFKNMFSAVEFFHDPILDRISQSSLGYILPKSLMSLRFRKNQTLDENQNIVTDKPEIKVTKKITNIHDVAKFDMYFEVATVLGGLTSGAYRKLINL